MKRILLVIFLLAGLLLTACSAPAATTTPGPSTTPGSTPTPGTAGASPSDVVRQFFAALEQKDYAKAYSLQAKTFQDEIPLEIFTQQVGMGTAQAGIKSQKSEVLEEKIQGNKATVSYRITSTMNDNSIQEGRGIYTLYFEGGAWKMNLLPQTS